MGWSVGFDSTWNRDIGYGVPSYCDHPGCGELIDRGLSHVCGGDPYGGERGCGLYFCAKHLIMSERLPQLCARCKRRRPPYVDTPDVPKWIKWKLTDPSWQQWRSENKRFVKELSKNCALHLAIPPPNPRDVRAFNKRCGQWLTTQIATLATTLKNSARNASTASKHVP